MEILSKNTDFLFFIIKSYTLIMAIFLQVYLAILKVDYPFQLLPNTKQWS